MTTGMTTDGIYDAGLERNAANFLPLSPVSFVARSAEVHPDRVAVIHGARRYSWAQVYDRALRLAAALGALGAGRGTTVSAMLANTPEMIEAHYAVPGIGAVLNTLNTRLDAALLAWQMHHCETAILLTDSEFAPVMAEALHILATAHGRTPVVIDVRDSEFGGGEAVGTLEYEALLAAHAPLPAFPGPADEWDAIAVSYTSGTTGDPKGVVTHHRGAYLNAVCNAVTWSMPAVPVFLWTLPLFHCNGWCFPWTIAMLAGTQVCLRRVDPAAAFEAMRAHRVDHYCGAPVVHAMLAAQPPEVRAGVAHRVRGLIAGAAPPAALLEAMDAIGFDLTHVYGLTEVYGPAAVCERQAAWAAETPGEQARLNARQGVRYPLQDAMTVLDPESMAQAPADGATIGEIMFRGNIMMKGYLKNPTATQAAFAGGWFHTGDLAVIEPDGYVKIRDRSKDVIISGGENISSLEVEECLYRHPAVSGCAVVGRPDARWGETPVAFVELKPDTAATPEELIAHCRAGLAHFKAPRDIRIEPLPRTATGKIQKFLLRKRVA